jgi:glycosyltransferase involved in cell wall biosynthesis
MAFVSVIIPSYNREQVIERAVRSVMAQTCGDIEIIVVDDGSTDGTSSLVAALAEQDQRIRYLQHHTNLGAQAARNTGIRAAQGEWIAFLDSDDEWLPQRLELELSLAHKRGVAVVYSECYVKNGYNNELKLFCTKPKSGDIYRDLLEYPGPTFQGFLVKKECLERIGYLDETITSYQEWDTAIQLARYYEFGFVETPLFIYHRHEDETISKDMKRDADGWAKIVEKHRKEILKVAGKDALKQHYRILANKYYLLGEFGLSSKYYFELSKLSSGFRKIYYTSQSLLAKNHINPNRLNSNRIIRYAVRFFKKENS